MPSYAFGVVPAFFLQGVQTSLSQIQSIPVGPARYINGVAIAWQRDKESKVDQNGPSGSFAIIFPKHQNSRSNFQLVERYRPEYFFMLNDWQALCEALSAAACANGEDIQRTRLQHCNEIVASLGLDNQSGETFLLTSEVRLNSVNTNDLSGVD